MGAGADELQPEAVGDPAQPREAVGEVGDDLGDVPADARDELDGVGEQLAVDLGGQAVLRGQRLDDGVGERDEVEGLPVDEGDLPLDPEGGAV